MRSDRADTRVARPREPYANKHDDNHGVLSVHEGFYATCERYGGLMLALATATFAAIFSQSPCGELGGGAIAEALLGWPRADLDAHARRESHCTVVGVHTGDSNLASTFAKNAVAAGCAPEWALLDPHSWGPRGPWGAAPAYAWCHLPVVLRFVIPPAAMDNPVLGAIIVGNMHKKLDKKYCAWLGDRPERKDCLLGQRGNAKSRRDWRDRVKALREDTGSSEDS